MTVAVNGDVIDEAVGIGDLYVVDLSNVVNASITDASGLGTITDDDDLRRCRSTT